MDIYWLLRLYRTVRRIFLYSDVHLIQTPEQIAEVITKANPGVDVTPADVLAALAYGTLCEDRFEFDIQIKYRTPRSHKHPAATFKFDGKPVKAWHVKRLSAFEKRYGQINFKKVDDVP